MSIGPSVSNLNDPATILKTAMAYHEAALNVVPVTIDGRKAVDLVKWAHLREQPPHRDLVDLYFYRGNVGIGILTSNHEKAFDFDDHGGRLGSTYESWCEMGERHLGRDRMDSLYVCRTGGNGYRVIYRCPEAEAGPKKVRLAAVPITTAEGKPGHDTLIELCQCGWMVIVPGGHPAVHPSGRLYTTLQGDLCKLPTLTEREHEYLVAAAMTFDEMPEREERLPRPTTGTTAVGDRPGDDFAADPETTWESILEPHGWTWWRDIGDIAHWTRPGKTTGTSATIGHDGHDTFYVWSSNASPFEANTGYAKFSAYAMLNHNGDFHAATKALAACGYGGAKMRKTVAEARGKLSLLFGLEI